MEPPPVVDDQSGQVAGGRDGDDQFPHRAAGLLVRMRANVASTVVAGEIPGARGHRDMWRSLSARCGESRSLQQRRAQHRAAIGMADDPCTGPKRHDFRDQPAGVAAYTGQTTAARRSSAMVRNPRSAAGRDGRNCRAGRHPLPVPTGRSHQHSIEPRQQLDFAPHGTGHSPGLGRIAATGVRDHSPSGGCVTGRDPAQQAEQQARWRGDIVTQALKRPALTCAGPSVPPDPDSAGGRRGASVPVSGTAASGGTTAAIDHR